MNISIPATEKLFEHYRSLRSFDFVKEFINELDIAQNMGRFYEKEFWDQMRSKNTVILKRWEQENERLLLSEALPSQLLYLKYLDSEIAKVAAYRLDRRSIEMGILEYRKQINSTSNFFYNNPRQGYMPESLLEQYIDFATEFNSELVSMINQAIGSLKIITSTELKSLPPEYSADNITTDDIIEDDARIPFKRYDRQRLIQDFLKLAKYNILSEEDARYWLCADFQGFKTPNVDRKLTPNAKASVMIYFLAQIYKKYSGEDRKLMAHYRNMLKYRITSCNEYKDEYLRKHFSDPKPSKFPAKWIINP